MTPYVDPTYFLLLLYPLLGLVILGVLGRLGRSAVLLVSLALVFYQYGDPAGDAGASDGSRQLIFLVSYALASTMVVLAYARARRTRRAQVAFYAAIALVLLPLVAVKVWPLAQSVAHAADVPVAAGPPLPPPPPGVPAPQTGLLDTVGFLGLSYMSLRVVDALIALHDGVVREAPSTASLLSYLLFVPTISAGPIDRFRHFAGELDTLPRSRREYLDDVEAGLHRVAQGFLYKFIFAYLVYRHALRPLATRPGALATVEYMYAFSAYLFFDFAGYSAFAIGVGRFFGIRVPENFNAPFLSRNFREMWDRWHISLSWWLRDHVYMRFMLTATRRKWFGGNARWAHAVGLLLTMGLMGCWHGLEPRYVVYGLYQGVMLIGYDAVARWGRRHGMAGEGRLAHLAGVFTTVNLFCFGLLIFSGRLFR
ncbi:MAG TPA: MBOAT family O-acyltransferase [Verrucomicrobiae bacterium]|nr:MBOAT family O-acyltransferase [Verrucomicrobiae bacterium]